MLDALREIERAMMSSGAGMAFDRRHSLSDLTGVDADQEQRDVLPSA